MRSPWRFRAASEQSKEVDTEAKGNKAFRGPWGYVSHSSVLNTGDKIPPVSGSQETSVGNRQENVRSSASQNSRSALFPCRPSLHSTGLLSSAPRLSPKTLATMAIVLHCCGLGFTGMSMSQSLGPL